MSMFVQNLFTMFCTNKISCDPSWWVAIIEYGCFSRSGCVWIHGLLADSLDLQTIDMKKWHFETIFAKIRRSGCGLAFKRLGQEGAAPLAMCIAATHTTWYYYHVGSWVISHYFISYISCYFAHLVCVKQLFWCCLACWSHDQATLIHLNLSNGNIGHPSTFS